MKTAHPIRLGVSACLLGQKVRYDGGHKRDPFTVDVLARFVEFVPVCPEAELGLGVPRESIRLEAAPEGVRLTAPRSGRDLTDDMSRYAARRVEALSAENLCGFILKKGSPSCGMERVPVHRAGPPERNGVGFFARALRERCPDLPVEEEGRLSDPRLRENFLERVFARHRLQVFEASRPRPGDWVRFHTAEKLLLMAHAPSEYAALGRLVAAGPGRGAPWADRYRARFMDALARPVPRGRHVNVLQHAAGYFRERAGAAERAEIARCIDEYRRGLVPLIVPATALRSAARVHGVAYLEGQTYLSPHPKELMLRNHV